MIDATAPAPTPIPTDGVWTGDLADLPNWDAMPRRNRRRKRRGQTPIWLRYAAALVALAAVLTVVQIAYHALRGDARDARAYAERELRLSALRPNERVVATVNVWQRPPIDYYRATRGLFVLTDAPGDSAKPIGGRLLYIGLQPRDPMSPVDAPPTFDERDWPVDTLVSVEPHRTFFFMSPGIAISAPRETRVSLGLPSSEEARWSVLQGALQQRYAALRAVGWQRREWRRARARDSISTLAAQRRAWYHTVRRGEALASVAKLFNTTPEQIRALNAIEGDRIRIGQTLMVKPETKKPVPYPAGVVPEGPPAVPDSLAATRAAPAPRP